MLEFAELLLRGLLLGAIYGLLAYPVSLLFATTDSVDLSVGAYAVLAAAITAAVGGVVGIAVGLLGAVAASLAVGLLSQRVNRRAHQDPLVVVLGTFGFATILESFVLTVFGKDPMVRQPWRTAGSAGAQRCGQEQSVGGTGRCREKPGRGAVGRRVALGRRSR